MCPSLTTKQVSPHLVRHYNRRAFVAIGKRNYRNKGLVGTCWCQYDSRLNRNRFENQAQGSGNLPGTTNHDRLPPTQAAKARPAEKVKCTYQSVRELCAVIFTVNCLWRLILREQGWCKYITPHNAGLHMKKVLNYAAICQTKLF